MKTILLRHIIVLLISNKKKHTTVTLDGFEGNFIDEQSHS